MIKEFTLKNNIKLLCESKENSNAFCAGFWFSCGSRFENSDNSGISHLTEHMLFKGTKTKTARELALTFDRIGGWVNAFTEKENICLYCTVPSEQKNITLAIEALCDMTENSVFLPDEFEKEKSVVEREIISVSEDAEESALDAVSSFVWKNTSLEKSISGSLEDVKKIQLNDLVKWYEAYIKNGELTVCAAGCFDEKELIELLEKLPEKNTELIEEKKQLFETEKNKWQNGKMSIKSDFQQQQLFLLYRYPFEITEKKYFTMQVFNSLTGDSMGSRLFESLRENTGYCYSVYSFFSLYKFQTAWCAYASTDRKNCTKVIELLMSEIEKLKNGEITPEEIETARNHLCGEEKIACEDTEYLMKRLFRNHEMHFSLFNTDVTIEKINAVTVQDIKEFTKELFDEKNMSLISYGPKIKRFPAINGEIK